MEKTKRLVKGDRFICDQSTNPTFAPDGTLDTQADGNGNITDYSYDALCGQRGQIYLRSNGNRTQLDADSVITASTYEPNSNRLDNLGGTDVLLDANGNTLNWFYRYTPHNRLKDATETATLKARYTYNGLGQRIGKTNAGTATGQYVLYGSNGERLVETDEQGNVLLEYLYLNTVNLGDLVLMHQFVTGSRTPTQNEFARADMNQDGEINAADLLLLQQEILQVMLGMPILAYTEQPCAPRNRYWHK